MVTCRHSANASERAPASERLATACVAGERHGWSLVDTPRMRASERQRANGWQRPAWPGNAMNSHRSHPLRVVLRPRAGAEAAQRTLGADGIRSLEDPVLPRRQAGEDLRLHRLGADEP